MSLRVQMATEPTNPTSNADLHPPRWSRYMAVVTRALRKRWRGWRRWKASSEGKAARELEKARRRIPVRAPKAVKGAWRLSSPRMVRSRGTHSPPHLWMGLPQGQRVG
jgi:hypothetical protein